MSVRQRIREFVREAYSKSVSTYSRCPCDRPVPKHIATRLAGYTREELEALPPEAVANSFGCGNPLAFSNLKEGDVVLDLGCGAGIDVLLAAKRVSSTGRVIGVDMTEELLVKARENIAASGLINAEVRKGIIEDLPVESESVDWVISNCVINLSPEKPKVFAEIVRVLKPGGCMIVSDIVAQELPEAVRRDRALYGSCLAGAISESEYLDGLRGVGLVDLEVRERIVYDQSHLRKFVEAACSEPDPASRTCCAFADSSQDASRLAQSLVGNVWSAKFFGRKSTG